MIFCVDIMSSWTLRQRKRWDSQQSGCFAFSRRTMPGLPELTLNEVIERYRGRISGDTVRNWRSMSWTFIPKIGKAVLGELAHTLKPLERDSLVSVAIDPGDRRNRLITLTRRGRAKLAETDVLWAKAQRGFEAALGRAESKALREVLRLLISDDFTAAFGNVQRASVR